MFREKSPCGHKRSLTPTNTLPTSGRRANLSNTLRVLSLRPLLLLLVLIKTLPGFLSSNYFTFLSLPNQILIYFSFSWEYNDNSSVNFITLSITVNGSDLCMDYNMTTMTVAVSLCYPSSVPATNRDTTQHWAWGNDALVRPYDYPDYCLSSSFLEGNFCIIPFFYVYN